MRAQAPGKVVLSGAYSVLEGSPAIVSAVDRYVVADSSRTAEWLTPEVRAAHLQTQPWFDARALRDNDRKLGLGSSAAILVASVAADLLHSPSFATPAQLAELAFGPSLAAHHAVQPLGSGVDVVSCCYGGTRVVQRAAGELQHFNVSMPPELHVEVWSSNVSQSTHHMLEQLFAFRRHSPERYAARMQAQALAAQRAADALAAHRADDFIAALDAQRTALHLLGQAAGIPIVTHELASLAAQAAEESAVVLPAGAGGGDIAVFVALRPPSAALREHMVAHRHKQLQLALNARGVHSVEKEC